MLDESYETNHPSTSPATGSIGQQNWRYPSTLGQTQTFWLSRFLDSYLAPPAIYKTPNVLRTQSTTRSTYYECYGTTAMGDAFAQDRNHFGGRPPLSSTKTFPMALVPCLHFYGIWRTFPGIVWYFSDRLGAFLAVIIQIL